MRPTAFLVCATLACTTLVLGACESAPLPPPPTSGRRDAGPCELIPEVCNGRDDDCNGLVDDVGEVEVCDGLDQDCDGAIDEGAACESFGAPGGDGWQLDGSSSGVIVTDDGALTLEPPRVDIVQPALWIANSDEGTVSRLDPATGHETGRFHSVDLASGLARGGMNAPSRTALDQRLDAYVANRAFGLQASVTKFAGDLERCVDRDLDGLITTSTDLDGDGVISTDPVAGELAEDDECVLWTVPVGGAAGGVARALAIGLAGPDGEPGDVWVGLFAEQRVVVLSRIDGHEIASIPIHLSPYGAVAGPDGRIWLTSGPEGTSVIVSVDAETYAVDQVTLPGVALRTYGISVDGLGRVVLAGNDRGWRGAVAYDPRSELWTTSADVGGAVSGAMGNLMRGIAASADTIWVAGPSGGMGTLFELSVADLSLRATHALPGVTDVVGVGVAFDGHVWGIARDVDLAFRLDRESGALESFPTGDGPYTYSDFTGFGLNGILGAIGTHRVTLEACDSAVWATLTLDADIPPEARVEVRVRSADTAAGLSTASWLGPFDASPTASLASEPGPVPAGRFLEISLRLWSSTPGIVPRVFSVSATARCDDVG